ncbi:MAG: oligosaccharide flippase family protein [Alphaproteobacteria bacterium]
MNTEPPSQGSERTLREKLLAGSLWMLAARWLVRLLSLVNLVVLARLLDKDDFGIVAMATAVTALPTALVTFGMEQAIIRQHRPSEDIYNTAWTIRAIQFAVVALLIFLSAPAMTEYFGDGRLLDVLLVLSAVLFIRGCESSWVISFRKQMRYKQDFLYESTVRVLAVAATIIIALVIQSYWALIIGQLIGVCSRLLISLFVVPQKPRITLKCWRALLSYSIWSLPKEFAGYVLRDGDKLIVGRLLTSAAVGSYTLGREVASMPLTEIAGPINRSLGPGFSELQHDRNHLVASLGKSLGAVALITFPMAAGLALTSQYVVAIVLGEKWLSAAPVLAIFALSGTFAAMRLTIDHALVNTGHIFASAVVTCIGAATAVGLAIPLTVQAGAPGAAIGFSLGILANLVALHVYCCVIFPLYSTGFVFRMIGRPVCGALLMALGVTAVAQIGIENIYIAFACQVVTGCLLYAAVIYILWRVSGYPDSAENEIAMRLGWPVSGRSNYARRRRVR